MGIAELIAKVGDENITFQNVLHSSPNMSTSGKDGVISFRTSKENVQQLMNEVVGGKSTLVALVVFIPRDKLPRD